MEKEFVCKFCNKKFPSGKSLGGHIRIHSPQSSVHSDSFIGKNNNSKKRLVDQRALASHMDCHNYEGKKMGTQSASETTTTTTSPGPTMIKRSKKQSSSESFSTVSWSSDPGIDQGSKDLMFLHLGRKDYNFNSLVPESSENNSEILETKTSSGELLKTPHKVSVVDDSDDGSSDSDYFMNGPKKSDSDVSVGGSLRNTGFGSGFNSFKNGDDLGVKEGGSKHELGKSKRVSPFYESDSSADTNRKFHRSSDGKSPMVKKASGGVKNSKGHECPICFKVYSSGQALGGHKRSHTTIANQAQRAKRKAADMQFDLNLPAEDTDD